jgi:YebC/PmpR family DNA-binding regulatory protein
MHKGKLRFMITKQRITCNFAALNFKSSFVPMGRAFEYRKDRKFKRWGQMAKAGTKIGKEIAIAVKEGGGDPAYNPRLRMAMQSAKAANMPKANVDNAIKRATSKDSENYAEVVYEGYGPHGIAIMVETLTDNTTRTVANMRMHFNKGGGNLGNFGEVGFMFDRKAVFNIKRAGIDVEELELDLIDHGLQEMRVEDGDVTLYVDFADFGTMQKALDERKIEVENAEFQRIANVTKPLTDEQFEDIIKLIDRLEDDDDVNAVFHSVDVSE